MGYRQIWKCDRCGHEQDYQWSHYDRERETRVGRDMHEMIVVVGAESCTGSLDGHRSQLGEVHKAMWCSDCCIEHEIIEELLMDIVDRCLDERGAGS